MFDVHGVVDAGVCGHADGVARETETPERGTRPGTGVTGEPGSIEAPVSGSCRLEKSGNVEPGGCAFYLHGAHHTSVPGEWRGIERRSGRLAAMKLCECGCGLPTPIATQTKRRDGHVKGEPMRFRRGHATRKRPGSDEEPALCACGCGQKTTVHRGRAQRYVLGHNSTPRRITSHDYTVEDRGHETPCWIWRHALSSHGGGQVTIRGKKTTAYRAMYEQERGPIPRGLVLDHLCEVRPCIRPDHLVQTTQGDHMRRHAALARSSEPDTPEGPD